VTDGAKNQITLNNFVQLEGGNSCGALLAAAMSGVPVEVAGDVRDVSASDVSSAAKATLKATPSYAGEFNFLFFLFFG